MKKIIILTDVFLPYCGGGQIYVWETAKRLVQDYELTIEIVTRKIIVDGKAAAGNESFFHGKLKITRLGAAGKWDNLFSRIWFIFAAMVYLFRQDFDLIDAQVFVAAIPGRIVGWLKHKPVILTVHGTTLEKKEHRILEKILLTGIKYDAQITAAANFLKIKNVNKKIYVAPPGVDADFFKPDYGARKKNRILFVGRLQKVKGTEMLMKCIYALRKENVLFSIVGTGEERDRISRFIKEKNITNAEMCGGLNKADVLKEYQKADLFFLPSVSEGFPLTVLEAMACGLPVVATDVGDMRCLATDHVNGFVVQSNHTAEFIDKISLILNDTHQAKIMSTNNIKFARKYSWEETAKKVHQVYEKLLQ